MTVTIRKPADIVKRLVRLEGRADIMFDRYAGDNSTQLEPHQKLYLNPTDGRTIGLPAVNIMSLLSAHNTNSAPKRLRDKRKFKDIANACLSYVTVSPAFIPLLRNGAPIRFGSFNAKEIDDESGCYIHRAVARLDKGIPNPKVRPDEGRTEPLETLTDGILERLVIAGLIDPERIEGWPENGMVLPLLAEMRGASA